MYEKTAHVRKTVHVEKNEKNVEMENYAQWKGKIWLNQFLVRGFPGKIADCSNSGKDYTWNKFYINYANKLIGNMRMGDKAIATLKLP